MHSPRPAPRTPPTSQVPVALHGDSRSAVHGDSRESIACVRARCSSRTLSSRGGGSVAAPNRRLHGPSVENTRPTLASRSALTQAARGPQVDEMAAQHDSTVFEIVWRSWGRTRVVTMPLSAMLSLVRAASLLPELQRDAPGLAAARVAFSAWLTCGVLAVAAMVFGRRKEAPVKGAPRAIWHSLSRTWAIAVAVGLTAAAPMCTSGRIPEEVTCIHLASGVLPAYQMTTALAMLLVMVLAFHERPRVASAVCVATLLISGVCSAQAAGVRLTFANLQYLAFHLGTALGLSIFVDAFWRQERMRLAADKAVRCPPPALPPTAHAASRRSRRAAGALRSPAGSRPRSVHRGATRPGCSASSAWRRPWSWRTRTLWPT